MNDEENLARRRRESLPLLIVLALVVVLGFGGLALFLILGTR